MTNQVALEPRPSIRHWWALTIALSAAAGRLDVLARREEPAEDEYPQSEQYAPGGGERDVDVAAIRDEAEQC